MTPSLAKSEWIAPVSRFEAAPRRGPSRSRPQQPSLLQPPAVSFPLLFSRATKVGRRGWGGTNVRVDAMVILPFEP